MKLNYESSDKEDFYKGRVFGEKSSNVSLHIDDGLLTGSIELESETYHFEVSIDTSYKLRI